MDINYTAKSVQGILGRLSQLEALRERGNVDAIVTLLDIKEAIRTTAFTARQSQILDLHFLKEYTVKETAAKLQISEPTVVEHKKEIAKRVYNSLTEGA